MRKSVISLEVKVRRMREFDLASVQKIDRELIGLERCVGWPPRIEAHFWFHRGISNYVAEVEGNVVGFILGDRRISEPGGEVGWIDMIGVEPQYRDMGIGRKLVEAFCDECHRNKLKTSAFVKAEDRSMKHFLKSLGFTLGNVVCYERDLPAED